MDMAFAKLHKMTLQQKSNRIQTEVIDGRHNVMAYETALIDVAIKSHYSKIIFDVINSPSHHIVFGISWREKYNPNIDW